MQDEGVMQKQTVLITGASGFIGSYLLPFLLERNYQIIALTRQPNRVSSHSALRWVNDLDQIETQHIDMWLIWRAKILVQNAGRTT